MVQDQPSVSIKHHGFKIVQARPSALAQDHRQEPAGWGFPGTVVCFRDPPQQKQGGKNYFHGIGIDLQHS